VANNKPPREVEKSAVAINFLGEKLSAITPPNIYENNATIPYTVNKLPS